MPTTPTPTTTLSVALLGLGEAGSALGAGLAARGAQVRGFDPASPKAPDGVTTATDAAEAARGADVVLSANSSAAAVEVAREVAPALSEEQLFADLNTASPAQKRDVADALGGRGEFADIALIAPVPGNGLHTPALASGPGARRFAELFGPLGMPVTVVGEEPGEAAARKLARSVFAKGVAASVGEALAAAEELGCHDWLYDDIERTFRQANSALLRRYIEGSRAHAARRVDEMAAAVAMLEELGVEPRIAAASEGWLRQLREEEAQQ
jgi:3-hydroxyisobutyrate dehydrogenase-like beta-hydroxyacid dehydrogenase